MPSPKPMDEGTQTKIQELLHRFTDIYRNELNSKQLNPRCFSLFKPFNSVQGIDKEKIFFLLYFDGATEGLTHVITIDLSEFGNVPPNELIAQIKHEKGFSQFACFLFPRALLSLPVDDLEQRLRIVVNESIQKEMKEIQRNTLALDPEVSSILPAFMDMASEDEFIIHLLIPLLHQMGFQRAKPKGHADKTLEFGNDIREMKFQLPTGHFIYFAAQVKAENINYGISKPSQNIERLLTEALMAFEKKFVDPEINCEVRVDHVFVITSGTINAGARDFLLERISLDKRRQVLFIDRDEIIRLAHQYGLPQFNQSSIRKKVRG